MRPGGRPGGGPKHQFRPRPGGGFNQGMGDFGEHIDENAFQQAAQQHSLSQAGANAGNTPAPQPQQHTPQQNPRELGSIQDELIKRPLQDIWQGLKSLFDINTILGINPEDTPEEQMKKKQIHSRYQQLDQEQQQWVQRRAQEEMQRKEAEMREEEEKKRMEEEQKQDFVMPSSPQKGPKGPAGGSKKQKATNQLQHNRKTMGQPQGAN